MDDPKPQYTASDARSFAEGEERRLHRVRRAQFTVCIALWALSVIPLARWLGDGAGAVLAIALAVGAVALGVAAAIRGLYLLLRKSQQFWSPWLFVIAAVLAIVSYVVQSAGHKGAILSFLLLN